MVTKKVEDGIRAYLDSLGQSDKPVVNREAIKALRVQIRDESDKLNKLRLIVALQEEEHGRVPDRSGDRAVFIAEAKAWADGNGITAEAFQSLGVPDEDLKEAGFTVTSGARRRTTSTSSRVSGSRAPRIALDDVLAAAHTLSSPWKLSDLAAAIGRDAATARNYVNKLLDAGSVNIVGDDPGHDGRGRAPKLYSNS